MIYIIWALNFHIVLFNLNTKIPKYVLNLHLCIIDSGGKMNYGIYYLGILLYVYIYIYEYLKQVIKTSWY